jgi:hypothetical protein
MTIAEQLHQSATYKPGSDPNCPVCEGKPQTALEKFVAACQALVDREYGAGKQILSIDPGAKKYARIVVKRAGEAHGSVYCFVDLGSGDVLKAASFKAPAKGARGNILAEDGGMSRMTAYGAGYNR